MFCQHSKEDKPIGGRHGIRAISKATARWPIFEPTFFFLDEAPVAIRRCDGSVFGQIFLRPVLVYLAGNQRSF